jgi:hypothetical protein
LDRESAAYDPIFASLPSQKSQKRKLSILDESKHTCVKHVVSSLTLTFDVYVVFCSRLRRSRPAPLGPALFLRFTLCQCYASQKLSHSACALCLGSESSKEVNLIANTSQIMYKRAHPTPGLAWARESSVVVVVAQIRALDSQLARSALESDTAVGSACGWLLRVSVHRSAARAACGSGGLGAHTLLLLVVSRLLILVIAAPLRATDPNLARQTLESDTAVGAARRGLLVLRATTRLVEVAPVRAVDLDLTRQALTSDAAKVAAHLWLFIVRDLDRGLSAAHGRGGLKEGSNGARRRRLALRGGRLLASERRACTTGTILLLGRAVVIGLDGVTKAESGLRVQGEEEVESGGGLRADVRREESGHG